MRIVKCQRKAPAVQMTDLTPNFDTEFSNERMSVKGYADMIRFYHQLLKNSA